VKTLAASSLSNSLSRDQKIDLIALIVLVGLGASVVYHYVLGVYLGMGYPFNTFLFRPFVRFSDLLIPVELRAIMNYPPFTLLVLYYPFLLLPGWLALGLFVLSFAGSFLYVLARNLRQAGALATARNVIILGLLSYPFLFTVDRANFEWVVFLLLYLFIVAYTQERRFLGPVFLALAISLKIFPAVFLVLLLAGRRYRETALTLGLTGAFTLLGLLVFDGGFIANWQRFFHALGGYTQVMAIGNGGWYFGHSLFGAIKFLLAKSSHGYVTVSILFAKIYLGLALIVFFALSFHLSRWQGRFWKQVLLLVLAMNLLPHVSADYKLLHIFIPLLLFVNQDSPEKNDLLYAILFGLLLIPKDYARLSLYPEASLSVLLTPMIMLFMAIAVIVEESVPGSWFLVPGRESEPQEPRTKNQEPGTKR
jgi:hypothetical protein